MTDDKLKQLRIASERKQRPQGGLWLLLGAIGVITAVVVFFAVPRASDAVRAGMTSSRDAKDKPKGITAASLVATSTNGPSSGEGNGAGRVPGSILTASGYIVNRERIEISPRFMGVVKWIGVKKGDSVTNGQVMVLLDDTEYRARLAEVDGQLAVARVGVERAQVDLKRAEDLVGKKVEMQKMLDDARLAFSSAEAQLKPLMGSRKIIETYLDWCVIRSPVNGVVLEKLVDPNELVTPQSFGGTRGPSTALVAVADPTDLQVEIDLGESDLAKVSLGQKCKVSPVAFREHVYDGVVVERAPEGSRQKGTIQLKVQILKPDRFLTPELSAQVDFLKE